jgi:hypothetical protein
MSHKVVMKGPRSIGGPDCKTGPQGRRPGYIAAASGANRRGPCQTCPRGATPETQSSPRFTAKSGAAASTASALFITASRGDRAGPIHCAAFWASPSPAAKAFAGRPSVRRRSRFARGSTAYWCRTGTIPGGSPPIRVWANTAPALPIAIRQSRSIRRMRMHILIGEHLRENAEAIADYQKLWRSILRTQMPRMN